MPQLISKPLAWFKTSPQVRKSFDEQNLRRLGESLRQKQLQPVLCQPDGTIIAGERRYRAAVLAGLPALEAKIADEPLDAAKTKVWQLTENMQRADLSGHEQWVGCAELMCMNPTFQMKDLADLLHLDPSYVTRLLSPSKCIPSVQEALATGLIGITACYAISKLPQSEQAGLLALKLSGASRDAIEQAGRKSRNGTAKAVRVNRIKCQVPGKGATVVVSGDAISLEDMIEAITELLKEAKKASERGMCAKTFERLCRDLAKKG